MRHSIRLKSIMIKAVYQVEAEPIKKEDLSPKNQSLAEWLCKLNQRQSLTVQSLEQLSKPLLTTFKSVIASS